MTKLSGNVVSMQDYKKRLKSGKPSIPTAEAVPISFVLLCPSCSSYQVLLIDDKPSVVWDIYTVAAHEQELYKCSSCDTTFFIPSLRKHPIYGSELLTPPPP